MRVPNGSLPLKVGAATLVDNQDFAGQKKALQGLVARYSSQGLVIPAETPVIVDFYVVNPSPRFRGSITVAFQPDGQPGVDPAFVSVPDWNVRAISRNPLTGYETPLQLAYPNDGVNTVLPLPDSYEFDTNAKELRVRVRLSSENFSDSYVASNTGVNLVAIAEWEPNTAIPEDEKNALFALCSLMVGPPVLIVNQAA